MKSLGVVTLLVTTAVVIGCSDSDTTTQDISSNNIEIIKGKLVDINETNQDKVLSSSLNIFKLDEALMRFSEESDNEVYSNRLLRLTLSKRVESHECDSGDVIIDDYGNGLDKDLDIKFENCKNNDVTIDGLIHYNKIINSKNFDAEVTNLKVTKGNKEIFYKSATLKVTTQEIKEVLSGYSKDGNRSLTFKDLKIDVIKLLNQTKYRVDGSLSSSCINNLWFDINTTKDIEKNSTIDCPTAGVVEIDGNSSKLTAKYNSDESIDIFLDGNLTKSYSSCDDMESDLEGECK